jgi:cytochrome c oxidase subunit IV
MFTLMDECRATPLHSRATFTSLTNWLCHVSAAISETNIFSIAPLFRHSLLQIFGVTTAVAINDIFEKGTVHWERAYNISIRTPEFVVIIIIISVVIELLCSAHNGFGQGRDGPWDFERVLFARW